MPECLFMGMEYSQFWRSNPRIVEIYGKAQRRKELYADQVAWNQGMYMYVATSVAIGQSFGGSNYTGTYPEKPLSDDRLSADELQRKREEREIQRLIAMEERDIAILRKKGLPESNAKG